MGEDRLSQEELALVLRRAAELDQATAGAAPDDDRLPVQAVEAAAAEVGLPATAVRQAVAELRAGLLVAGSTSASSVDPSAVIEAAVVPLDVDAALDAVGRWLAAQTFHRHRGRDGMEVWRVREDWLATLQRRLDWSASVRLKGVRQVVVRAVAVEGGTLVRLEAALEGVGVAAPGIGAGGGAAVGGLTGVGAGVAVSSGYAVVTAAGAGLAGVGAFGGWLAGRSVRQNRRLRISVELAAELDRIATGIGERNTLDRLRARARRTRGAGWA